MDRFQAHIRRSNTQPGEVIPPSGILTHTDWIRLKITGFVAETRRGVFVLTVRGHHAAWDGFVKGAPELTMHKIGWM